MGIKTDVIVFNAAKRGRKFRGVDRDFDTLALSRLINSGAVQERVKMRDMMGYYGHWPRSKFGMDVPEAAIVDGRQVNIEPAFITTLLEADPDGTIRHQAEFLDTKAGQLSQRIYTSKAGGFSSAIRSKRAGGKSVPISFHGFDFVLEPNFAANRGYSVQLDGVHGEVEIDMLDAVEEYHATIDGTMRLFDSLQHSYDSLQGDYGRAMETIARLQEENEAYLSMLAKQNRAGVNAQLDGVRPARFGGGESRINRAEATFFGSHLVGFEPNQADAEQNTRAAAGHAVVDRLLAHR